MLNDGQIRALRRGVNTALGLPDLHKFGTEFVSHFIEFRCEFPDETQDIPVTSYERMREWVKDHRFSFTNQYGTDSLFKLAPNRHNILIGILECLQAVLRVELLNEGGDKPLPPDVPKDALVRAFTKSEE